LKPARGTEFRGDAPALELVEHVEGVAGGPEHAVELGGDDDVARLEGGQELRAL
jgi:hypothetical protein